MGWIKRTRVVQNKNNTFVLVTIMSVSKKCWMGNEIKTFRGTCSWLFLYMFINCCIALLDTPSKTILNRHGQSCYMIHGSIKYDHTNYLIKKKILNRTANHDIWYMVMLKTLTTLCMFLILVAPQLPLCLWSACCFLGIDVSRCSYTVDYPLHAIIKMTFAYNIYRKWFYQIWASGFGYGLSSIQYIQNIVGAGRHITITTLLRPNL